MDRYDKVSGKRFFANFAQMSHNMTWSLPGRDDIRAEIYRQADVRNPDRVQPCYFRNICRNRDNFCLSLV